MDYEWDPDKATTNQAKHGVDFCVAEGFEWDAALVWADVRGQYGEVREIAFAPIDHRLHVMVFTLRGEKIRMISLRKANKREVAVYEQAFNRRGR
ncbi:MAG: phage protein [Magnetococcales bacterium]|nr:phage protein [Magnetococcales bacterium]HIJ84576.1 BrnT family toxin [Magnetococcales bacterium]